MGTLYEICQMLMGQLETQYTNPMDLLRVKGEIARSAGFMVSMVTSQDADDPAKIAQVRNAARQLGINL